MTTAFYISQLCAFLALISDIASFQYKKREAVLVCIIISATLNALHFWLLGRLVAFSMVSVGIIRFIISYFYTDKRLMYLFFSIFAAITFYFYKSPVDLLMFFAISLINFWVFQKKDRFLRLFIMPWTSLVILYNFLIGSPMGMVLEAVFLGSNIVGYYRHYVLKSPK